MVVMLWPVYLALLAQAGRCLALRGRQLNEFVNTSSTRITADSISLASNPTSKSIIESNLEDSNFRATTSTATANTIDDIPENCPTYEFPVIRTELWATIATVFVDVIVSSNRTTTITRTVEANSSYVESILSVSASLDASMQNDDLLRTQTPVHPVPGCNPRAVVPVGQNVIVNSLTATVTGTTIVGISLPASTTKAAVPKAPAGGVIELPTNTQALPANVPAAAEFTPDALAASRTLTKAHVTETVLATVAALNSAPPAPVPAGSKAPGAIVTLGDTLYTAGPSGLAFGSTTLAPGGDVALVEGKFVSVGTHFIVIDGNVIPYTSIPEPTPAATFSFQGQVYTAAPTGFAIGSVTFKPGSPGSTLSGQYISAASDKVILGKSTVSLTTVPPMATVTGGVYTLGGRSYTYYAGTGMVIGTATLTAGGPDTTIAGTAVSVAASGVLIGTDSFAMSTVTRTLNSPGMTPSGSIVTAPGSPPRTRIASASGARRGSGLSESWRGVRYVLVGMVLMIGCLLI